MSIMLTSLEVLAWSLADGWLGVGIRSELLSVHIPSLVGISLLPLSS